MYQAGEDHHHREQRGIGYAGDAKANAAQHRLNQCGDHHAERHGANRLSRQQYRSVAALGGKTRGKITHSEGDFFSLPVQQGAEQQHQRTVHQETADVRRLADKPGGRGADVRANFRH